jgi:O-antigen ligase
MLFPTFSFSAKAPKSRQPSALGPLKPHSPYPALIVSCVVLFFIYLLKSLYFVAKLRRRSLRFTPFWNSLLLCSLYFGLCAISLLDTKINLYRFSGSRCFGELIAYMLGPIGLVKLIMTARLASRHKPKRRYSSRALVMYFYGASNKSYFFVNFTYQY